MGTGTLDSTIDPCARNHTLNQSINQPTNQEIAHNKTLAQSASLRGCLPLQKLEFAGSANPAVVRCCCKT
eukprot:6519914-Lingulodinium_polyedra.AAC.1